MFKTYILIVLSLLCVKSQKDIFDLDADDIVASEIGDIYEARRLLNSIPDDTDANNIIPQNIAGNKDNNARKFNSKTNNGNITTTTERIRLATPSPNDKILVNITVKDIRRRIMLRQLEKVLTMDYKYMPNYNVEVDHLTELTRRFDKLVEEHKARENETRRELYIASDNQPRIWLQKQRYLNIMSQFVYMTRYKLVFSQLLRNRYINNARYKLGYLFALVRHVKNMQKWVYSALKTWETWIHETINFHMKLFERIMRFDIDIKDVIKMIIRMEYLRNMAFNPKFYDYSLEEK